MALGLTDDLGLLNNEEFFPEEILACDGECKKNSSYADKHVEAFTGFGSY